MGWRRGTKLENSVLNVFMLCLWFVFFHWHHLTVFVLSVSVVLALISPVTFHSRTWYLCFIYIHFWEVVKSCLQLSYAGHFVAAQGTVWCCIRRCIDTNLVCISEICIDLLILLACRCIISALWCVCVRARVHSSTWPSILLCFLNSHRTVGSTSVGPTHIWNNIAKLCWFIMFQGTWQ
jgi:hypothetical protein